MMRIRSIKPSVHTDEELWDLELRTRLPIFRAFTGLWSAADREGRFEWRPRKLKAEILPYWDGDFGDVLVALRDARFVIQYEHEGVSYGHVRTFHKHQVVNQREAKSILPEPSTCTHVHARGEQEQEGNMEQERERIFPARVREEQDSSQETDKRRGSDFMLAATCLPWLGHDQDLMLIGARPENERRAALAAIQSDPWCQSNIERVSPRHVLRQWNRYSSGNRPMQLAKVVNSETELWSSRVQESAKKLEELRAQMASLDPSGPNYRSDWYDLDKGIREETERFERRRRELHALTG